MLREITHSYCKIGREQVGYNLKRKLYLALYAENYDRDKQIDKIIREKYDYEYTPIVCDGEDGILFSLDTDAPINEFNPIYGQIQWKNGWVQSLLYS